MAKKQTDGRYRAKITIGNGSDGKPIYKYVSGRTQRELEDAKAAARKHFIDGAVQRQDALFSDYAMAWYRAKKEPVISDSSRASYAVYLSKHIIPAFGARMLRAVQPLEIQTWINGYSGKSKSMINGLLAAIKAIFESAYGEGIISRDPCIGLVRPKPTPPEGKRALTDQECEVIEGIIPTHEFGDMLAVFYYTGMRRGEVLGLQWGDFDWDNSVIHVQRDIDYTDGSSGTVGPLKSKASYRDVPIEEEFRAVLQERKGPHGAFLFSTGDNVHLCLSTFLRRWMRLMIDCGFATPVECSEEEKAEEKVKKLDLRYDWECDITPHYFRHNYATVLYEAGVDPLVAMRILGHADYATTVKIYTHLNNMHIENAKKQLSEKRSQKKVAEKLPEGESSRKVKKERPPRI